MDGSGGGGRQGIARAIIVGGDPRPSDGRGLSDGGGGEPGHSIFVLNFFCKSSRERMGRVASRLSRAFSSMPNALYLRSRMCPPSNVDGNCGVRLREILL